MMELSDLQIAPMAAADLDEVMAIENSVYSHPWTRAGFTDALSNGDDAWVLRDKSGELLAYFVQMSVVDEAHLLTVAVKAAAQRQGLGRTMLDLAVQQARRKDMKSMLLEVRVSNLAALNLYKNFGFEQIGLRKNYYQLNSQQREDALVLRYVISALQSDAVSAEGIKNVAE